MARMKLEELKMDRLYVVVYGKEGSGKTRLITSLSKNNGKDVGIITAERGGLTSLRTANLSKSLPVELVDKGDPFEPTIRAIKDFTRDPSITTIGLDGVTAICGQAVNHFTQGAGMKDMGYDGWNYVLSSFMSVELALEAATRAGKSVVITGWEAEPNYGLAPDGRTQILKDPGRLYLMGKAQKWLPGKVDIVARLSGRFKKEIVNGKPVEKWEGKMQVRPTDEWHAKTRWNLPNPCPANLQFILDLINSGEVQEVEDVLPVRKAAVKKV